MATTLQAKCLQALGSTDLHIDSLTCRTTQKTCSTPLGANCLQMVFTPQGGSAVLLQKVPPHAYFQKERQLLPTQNYFNIFR